MTSGAGNLQRQLLVDVFAAVGATAVTARRAPVRRSRSIEFDYSATLSGWRALRTRLEAAGFVPFRALRDGHHRFLIGHDRAGWVKVDVKLDRTGVAAEAGRFGTNLLWAFRRRRGPIVAIVGADGAGKSTVVQGLVEGSPFAASPAYLGSRRHRPGASGRGRTARQGWRVLAGVIRWSIRSLVRLGSIHLKARGGQLVVCDRHPVEAGFLDRNTAGLAGAVRRTVARHLLPHPDRFILLTAPGATLFARKGEHSPEALDAMNGALHSLIEWVGGTTVDATRPADEVLSDVEDVVMRLIGDRLS